jgi:hypothetical protein
MSKDFKNTVEKGMFRYVVYRQGKTWYAVALEFNLVVSGKDQKAALIELITATGGYVKAVKKSNSRPFALNQKIDREYLDLWNLAVKPEGKTVKSPYTIYSYGAQKIIKA